jgi:hypothetical protein
MEKQLFEKYDGGQVTDSMLQEAAVLFSENYGVWGEHAAQVTGNFAKAGKCIKLSLGPSANYRQVLAYVSVKTGFELNTYTIIPHALMSGLLLTDILLVMHSPAVGRSITNLCVGLLSW